MVSVSHRVPFQAQQLLAGVIRLHPPHANDAVTCEDKRLKAARRKSVDFRQRADELWANGRAYVPKIKDVREHSITDGPCQIVNSFREVKRVEKTLGIPSSSG